MGLKQIVSFQGVSFDGELIVSPRWPHHVLKLLARSSLIVMQIVSPNATVVAGRQAWQLPRKANYYQA